MTDDRSQQKDQGLSNLSVDPELLARELAAEEDVDPLDAIQLDDTDQDSSLEIARGSRCSQNTCNPCRRSPCFPRNQISP